jgi:predicted nucleic acid-binding protein
VRSPYIKPYVESSVFIAFIKGEKSQGPTRDRDARAIFDSIIDAARARKFRIITSALTIAEVHKYKKYPKEQQVTQRQNEDLRPYFRQDYIQIVEIDREVGEKANELCVRCQAGSGHQALRPNDAIHIASAQKAGCDVVLSWDSDFISQKGRIAISLENPDMMAIG